VLTERQTRTISSLILLNSLWMNTYLKSIEEILRGGFKISPK
jgi:hypothetical protein